jgi:hypothetical protein
MKFTTDSLFALVWVLYSLRASSEHTVVHSIHFDSFIIKHIKKRSLT